MAELGAGYGAEELELKLLIEEELKVIANEEWITKTLTQIKEQIINLSVEVMQLKYELECKIAEKNNIPTIEGANDESNSSLDIDMLDQENSTVNTKQLDLSVLNDFHSLRDKEYSEEEDDEDFDLNT